METQKINVAAILVVALTGIIVTVVAASLLMAYQRVPNYGYVKSVGVGVYWDQACTENVTSIDWEILEPGSNRTQVIWIKNTGNTQVVLNMTTGNWTTPEAENYISLTWNREGQILNANQSISATLTLSVSTTITETDIVEFSFDMIITGTEQES